MASPSGWSKEQKKSEFKIFNRATHAHQTLQVKAMSDNKKAEVDSETILMTLDQIGQTIDIMTNVVSRLRGYITEQIDNEMTSDLDIPEGKPLIHKESQTLH